LARKRHPSNSCRVILLYIYTDRWSNTSDSVSINTLRPQDLNWSIGLYSSYSATELIYLLQRCCRRTVRKQKHIAASVFDMKARSD
jgi:hypothetical protein